MKPMVTDVLRAVYFAITMVPLASLFAPWLTLHDGGGLRTGITCITLLVSPIREYLFIVAPVQATIITLTPLLTVFLSIVIGIQYYRRKRKIWLPVVMLLLLASSLAVIYLTSSLAAFTHEGPRLVLATAMLLMLHQAAIQAWVSRRKFHMSSRVSRPLAIAAAIRRWR